MPAMIVALALGSMLAGQRQVELKLYRGDQNVLDQIVIVNQPLSVPERGGISVYGLAIEEVGSEDVQYELNFSDRAGNEDFVEITAPIESCVQRLVKLGITYTLRVCGVQ